MNKKEAVERLLSSFSQVPAEWVQTMSEKNGDDFYGVMWSTMWIVNDLVDKSRIEKLLVPVKDEENENYNGYEVEGTGINAWYVADELVLGINGAGYDFYDSHWFPLYDALGYNWHDKEETITK